MKKEVKANGKKNKLPFALFVCSKEEDISINTCEEIINEIVSNRIKEKYK